MRPKKTVGKKAAETSISSSAKNVQFRLGAHIGRSNPRRRALRQRFPRASGGRPSSCGKTTLLNAISGIIRPSEGRVLFDGVDVTAVPTAQGNIAQVFQFPVIYRTMTVFENLAFGRRKYFSNTVARIVDAGHAFPPPRCRRLPQREIRDRVGEVAKLLNLTDVLLRAAL